VSFPSKFERHNFVLIVPLIGYEGHILLIFPMEGNMMIPREGIHKTWHGMPCTGIHQLVIFGRG